MINRAGGGNLFGKQYAGVKGSVTKALKKQGRNAFRNPRLAETNEGFSINKTSKAVRNKLSNLFGKKEKANKLEDYRFIQSPSMEDTHTPNTEWRAKVKKKKVPISVKYNDEAMANDPGYQSDLKLYKKWYNNGVLPATTIASGYLGSRIGGAIKGNLKSKLIGAGYGAITGGLLTHHYDRHVPETTAKSEYLKRKNKTKLSEYYNYMIALDENFMFSDMNKKHTDRESSYTHKGALLGGLIGVGTSNLNKHNINSLIAEHPGKIGSALTKYGKIAPWLIVPAVASAGALTGLGMARKKNAKEKGLI